MLDLRSWRRLRRAAMLAVVLLLAAPGSALGFAKAFWGPGYSNGANNFPVYRQLGVTIYEDDLLWSDVAPTRPRHPTNPDDPAYHWPAALQRSIDEAAAFHIRVMLQVVYTPPWANGGRSREWAPLRPSDFAAFVTAAARHYRTVHLWMIWGEPNREGHFEPIVRAKPYKRLNAAQQVAPHNYARVLDAAYGALKAVSRSNLVIGGNTYTGGYLDTQQWIANLRLPNGRTPRMDMYGHDPFSYTPPSFNASPSPFGEVQFSDLPRLARWVDRYLRRGMPLFISEWSIATAPGEEFPFWVDAPVAARWITTAMRLSRRWHRIYALGWIHLYDDPPLSYGGLLTVTGQQKPLFAAFAHG